MEKVCPKVSLYECSLSHKAGLLKVHFLIWYLSETYLHDPQPVFYAVLPKLTLAKSIRMWQSKCCSSGLLKQYFCLFIVARLRDEIKVFQERYNGYPAKLTTRWKKKEVFSLWKFLMHFFYF